MLPVSKSIAQRILVMQALAGVPIGIPADLSVAEDVEVLLRALNQRSTLIGANGTAYRLLTAYLWEDIKGPNPSIRLTGTPRLLQRPIEPLKEALRALDRGESDIRVDNRLSSQFVTALLLVAPRYQRDLSFHLLDERQSRSYIRMTITLMRQWGISIEETSETTILVHAGHYAQPANWADALEPDWSAAAVWFEWTALQAPHLSKEKLSERLELLIDQLGLRRDSLQGDRKVVLLMQDLLAGTSELDMHDTPDLVPYLWVTAHCLGIPVHFTGINTLRYKESDRLTILQHLPPSPAVLQRISDHRIAMAFAVAGWEVGQPDCVRKSYPDFWHDFCTQKIR